MIQVNYNNCDYISLLRLMAHTFRAQLDENVMRLPKAIGKGFFSAFNLPKGISVMLSDSLFYDDILMHRNPSNQHYFILQFNEPLNHEVEHHKNLSYRHVYDLQKNIALLTSTLMDSYFKIPARIRIRSVRIILSNDFLNNFIGKKMADKFLANYFSMILKRRDFEHVDTGYRMILEELVKEKIDHPLRTQFIWNRLMLLIEKLITGFMNKLKSNKEVVDLEGDEISRLIKVESLLVKDYSKMPPTIAALSKVATMSPTKLKKNFKFMYGFPLYEYYQKNRMMRAKLLLMEGRFAVKEVGMRVGYSNLGHFAASFKKEFGMLPREIVIDGHRYDGLATKEIPQKKM